MDSSVLIALSENQEVRIYVANTTEMVEKSRVTHNLSPVSAAAMGRTLTATAMMGRMAKNEKEKLTVQIKGSGNIKLVLAVSDSKGNVKGYISNPNVDNVLNAKGKLDVGGAIGKDGEIIVIKDYGLKEPFIGRSALVSGEIAEDLTQYFATSEQQPTAVSLGVYVNMKNEVELAGGFIVQLMPFASDETIDKLEANIKELDSFTQMMKDGMDSTAIAEKVLEGLGCSMTLEYPARLQCDCSVEKMSTALSSIGAGELKQIILEDDGAELECHFCMSKYKFTGEELQAIIDSL